MRGAGGGADHHSEDGGNVHTATFADGHAEEQVDEEADGGDGEDDDFAIHN